MYSYATRLDIVLAAFLLAFAFLLPPLAHADCINSYGIGSTAPNGYGAAWNPFSASRELLVQATTCQTGSATMTVGSGDNAQFVYNKGYFWTGSQWKSYTLTGTTPLQGNAWYTGKATGNIQLPQTTTYVVGYVCQEKNGSWKCGCRDAGCSTAYWQLQAVANRPTTGGGGSGGGGGGYVAGGPQCEGASPPPQAQAAGYTKLDFCDDFSTPSIDTTGNDQTKVWTSKHLSLWANSANNPDSIFTWNSDGTLTVKPIANYSQQTFNTFRVVGGQPVGYYIDRKSGFYVEVRWKHSLINASKNFPAFWMMDICHMWNYPNGCGTYLEPDIYEYISGREYHSLHHWGDDSSRSPSHYHVSPVCYAARALPSPAPQQFFTTGMLMSNFTKIQYYTNDALVVTRTKGDGCFSNAAFDLLKTGRYPILLGAGPGGDFTVDYVRVWVNP